MKNNNMELVFILDMSGSMTELTKSTIGGFNSLIDEQKTVDGKVNVSTVLFNDSSKVLHDRVPLEKVKHLTEREYRASGCTALLDAVGGAIHHIGNVQKYSSPEYRAEKVLFVITTDGYENASREYSYQNVRSMIERQKEKYGWEFIFLGANIDAEGVAERFGIDKSHAGNYMADEEGTKLNYEAMNCAIKGFRENSEIDECWKAEVDKDYRNRNR